MSYGSWRFGRLTAFVCAAAVGAVGAVGSNVFAQAEEPKGAPPPAPTTTPAPAPKAAPVEVQTVSGFEVFLKVPETEGNLKATRVMLLLSKVAPRVKEPRGSLQDWFNPPQILGKDWKATDGKMKVDDSWTGYPKKLADIEPAEYWIQAVVRRNQDGAFPGFNTGDVYSKPVRAKLDPTANNVITIDTETVHQETPMRLNDRARIKEMKSEALSAFYGREVNERAAIYLPKDFDKNTDETYATIIAIGGFGSTHTALGNLARTFPPDFLEHVIFVVPDPSTYYGHSGFADSANNGPRAKALVEELIPAIEKEFRGRGAEHRYVTGISSGGWASLWLQVTRPDDFAGCWSFCPDPVDFRDFQQIDLYSKDANMYTDSAGARRPLARQNDVPALWYDNFVAMESAIGPSGQIGAFEAAFSPRGSDGRPVPLFDRATGKVDPAVAKAWEKYDIRKVVESNWSELSKKLVGKVHVFAGGKDTFYLDGAAKLLKDSMKSLASDAQVEVVPGLIHTIYRPGITGMVRHVATHEGFTIELTSPPKPKPAPDAAPEEPKESK